VHSALCGYVKAFLRARRVDGMDDFEKLSFGIEEDELLDEHAESLLSAEGLLRASDMDELLDDVYLGAVVDREDDDDV
jgi:hypothetical protein